jgi:anti-sigma factor RsiW
MEIMCPDRQILSVYFDNELASPWKEKLEKHVSGCPDCGARLEAYKKMRKSLPGAKTPALRAAEDRIWEKIAPLEENHRKAAARRFWGASITVPFPLAAAAGLVLITAFALLLVLRPVNTPVSQFAGTGMEVQSISDMNSLLEYLNKIGRAHV